MEIYICFVVRYTTRDVSGYAASLVKTLTDFCCIRFKQHGLQLILKTETKESKQR